MKNHRDYENRFQQSTFVGPHPSIDTDNAPRPVVGKAIDIDGARSAVRHSHKRAQLIYATKGTLTVKTDKGIWVAPPDRAVWIPGSVEHEVSAPGPTAMRTLYFDETVLGSQLPRELCVLTISPLMSSLIQHIVEEIPLDYDENGADGRLVAVMLDQLHAIDSEPLSLPTPTDPKVLAIHQALMDNPADCRGLGDWAKDVGASPRTLARLFTRQTGLTFGRWRQRIRLLSALERLSLGHPVTTVAMDLGYDSPSAFIAMFRKTMGQTPGRYYATPD